MKPPLESLQAKAVVAMGEVFFGSSLEVGTLALAPEVSVPKAVIAATTVGGIALILHGAYKVVDTVTTAYNAASHPEK